MNAFDYFFENTKQLDKPFLVGTESIMYKDLFNSSLQLAHKLRNELGEKKNILLISANNLFFIKSYLAILKSGNICIPLDPGTERENFSYILRIADPKLIFATRDISRKLPIDSYNCSFPDSVISDNCALLSSSDIVFSNDNDCAEIIFTSGSTGTPKGVMISHKNIIANTTSILSYLNLCSDDRILIVLPFYYCYGLSLLHTHLRVGGSIVLNNSFIFLGKIISDLLDSNCTGFAGVPSHFQILLRKSDSFKKTTFPSLRYVTQAGGGLATTFVDEFNNFFPEIRFFIMYGQTEATARLSYLPPDLYEKKKGSIGKGIPGVELKIINDLGEEIKPGITGEVIARGDNIMLGYYFDEEGTASTIIDGWLHTGDIGTIDKDHFIYLSSRKKEILKVGGKRISPKEIEEVILGIPQVIECQIEGFIDELLGEGIKAIIKINAKEEHNLTIDSIKQYCSKYLARYKIPQIIEIRNHLGITATGKIKKKGNIEIRGLWYNFKK